jgi:subtilisin family serine protease
VSHLILFSKNIYIYIEVRAVIIFSCFFIHHVQINLMRIYNHRVELIIDQSSIQAKSKGSLNLKKQLSESGVPVEAIITKAARLPKSKKALSKVTTRTPNEKIYVKTGIRDAEMNPWDIAHLSSKAIGAQSAFIEPNLLHEFAIDSNTNAAYKRKDAKAMAKSTDNGYDPDWEPGKNIIWHLGDTFSQLKAAREAVAASDYVVRIGHLDTGYDPTHTIVPASAKANKLQRNFVEDENELDAHDPRISGTLRMPGHGTGTLGILAGNKVRLTTDNGIFEDYLGGAPFAEIICCRISPTVVLFKTSAFSEAINYLVGLTQNGIPVHVASMSMGGAPSRAWAKAVNAAYEAGITLVTATGNNFNGLPTTHVIYPARFGRVIAACGVTYDLHPYQSGKLGEMQGCYGPEKNMTKALAAFTPNIPWARGSASVISYSGAGTSSATPQIASAAAIYYRKYHTELDQLPGWQRVEAIRYALYKRASQNGTPDDSFKKSFGNGIIKAFDALQEPVKIINEKTPEDKIPLFPILTTIFKAVPKSNAQPGNRIMMFNTELAQLVFYYPELDQLIGNEEKSYDKVSKKEWQLFKDAVIQHPGASLTLKKYLMATNF